MLMQKVRGAVIDEILMCPEVYLLYQKWYGNPRMGVDGDLVIKFIEALDDRYSYAEAAITTSILEHRSYAMVQQLPEKRKLCEFIDNTVFPDGHSVYKSMVFSNCFTDRVSWAYIRLEFTRLEILFQTAKDKVSRPYLTPMDFYTGFRKSIR